MRFGLVAGESSGDLLGAGLITAIRERVPDATFEGVAGPAMIGAGCDAWEQAEVLAVMGLVEPLRHLPRLLRLRRDLVSRWTANPPDVFVGIDAPDFNLGLEMRLRGQGIRTVHYVSPSVWAWRQGRIKTIRKAADLVLCILPFEKDFYDRHGVDAAFVGHPKADAAAQVVDVAAARAAIGVDIDAPVVAVLPGSRGSEVSRLGPVFADTVRILSQDDPGMSFVVPAATPKLRTMIESQLADAGAVDKVAVLDGRSETAMAAADVVLLASGTAALEAALLQKPTVAAYKVAAMTAAIVNTFNLIKVDKFTIPNLLTEEPLVPEYIQSEATPAALAAAVSGLMTDDSRRAEIARRFAKLRGELALDANAGAAEAVLGLVTG